MSPVVSCACGNDIEPVAESLRGLLGATVSVVDGGARDIPCTTVLEINGCVDPYRAHDLRVRIDHLTELVGGGFVPLKNGAEYLF